MSLTTDRNHPDLKYGANDKPVEQNKAYLVLSEDEIAKGYVKPYRDTYKHLTCNTTTKMNSTISATYARDPYFYGATYCCNCMMHKPLNEFVWENDESMSPSLWSEDEKRRIAKIKR